MSTVIVLSATTPYLLNTKLLRLASSTNNMFAVDWSSDGMHRGTSGFCFVEEEATNLVPILRILLTSAQWGTGQAIQLRFRAGFERGISLLGRIFGFDSILM